MKKRSTPSLHCAWRLQTVRSLFELSTYKHPYQEGKLGQIVEGAYADLLIVDGNPLKGVDCVMKDETKKVIMKDGVVYKNTL